MYFEKTASQGEFTMVGLYKVTPAILGILLARSCAREQRRRCTRSTPEISAARSRGLLSSECVACQMMSRRASCSNAVPKRSPFQASQRCRRLRILPVPYPRPHRLHLEACPGYIALRRLGRPWSNIYTNVSCFSSMPSDAKDSPGGLRKEPAACKEQEKEDNLEPDRKAP
jgi:hypothetical protein